ncbi:MAG: phosphoglycerate kinase, partial [Prevotellaceae bacterium]|nr:phosphoglycerate kinase [Prevotellaceae bacterium]
MQSIDNYDFHGKRAIVRFDFNVPLNEKFEVSDDTRIRAAIPTINKIFAGGGSIIAMTHLGRPKGVAEKYSLKHIIPTLEKLIGKKVIFAPDCVGEEAVELSKNLKPGDFLLLENLRFYAEEEGKPRLSESATQEEKDAAKKELKIKQKDFV